MTEQRLNELENNVYELSNRLNVALSELSEAASEIYGQEIVADFCGGAEIEFRRLDNDGFINDYDCIRMEEIKNLL